MLMIMRVIMRAGGTVHMIMVMTMIMSVMGTLGMRHGHATSALGAN